jgi:hypothetical protein
MLTTIPQTVALTPSSSQLVYLISTLNDLTTPTWTGLPSQISASKISGDATKQIWNLTSNGDANGWFAVGVADTNSTDLATVNVSVANFMPSVPQGYPSLTAVQYVRDEINEPNLPSNQTVLNFLNRGVEQVESFLGALRLWGVYPTVANQTTQALTNDTQEVLSCSWSTGPVTNQGSLVYPMQQLDQGSFMDNAGGFPNVGFGPPQWWFTFMDQNNVQQIQMYPAAMVGQLNVYYRARPNLWTLTAGGANAVQTNIDSIAQEAVLIFAMIRTLRNRGRAAEAKQVWEPEFAAKMQELKDAITKRTAPKGGQVRDVRNRSYPSWPYFF